jgi:Domain of unknown function (DUF4440)
VNSDPVARSLFEFALPQSFRLAYNQSMLRKELDHEELVRSSPSYRLVVFYLSTRARTLLRTGLRAMMRPLRIRSSLLDAFMHAWERQDAAALVATLAPEFLYVSSRGLTPREGVVAALTHACTLTSYSLSDVRVVPISWDSAAPVYKMHQSASCAGPLMRPWC